MITIVGVSLTNRVENAAEFQKILTEHGCDIRTRLGLHPRPDESCLNNGIVLLEVHGDPTELVSALKTRWEVQTMVFG
jgi:hypothetical protein